LLAVTLLVGALIWGWATAGAMPVGGYSGLSLWAAGAGVVMLALAGLPAVAGGVLLAERGNVLGGPFVVSGALLGVALVGGGMDGWFWRQASAERLPGAYTALAAETLVWLGVVLLPLVVARWRAGGKTTDDEPAGDEMSEGGSTPGVGGRLVPVGAPGAGIPGAGAWLGAVIAAAAAGVLIMLMLRTTDPMQVAGTLLASFAIGAMVARTFLPGADELPVLVSPAVVAVAAYLYVAWSGQYGSTAATLAAWYSKIIPDPTGPAALPGVALALPVAYASAGVLGCTVGIGIAQGFARARVQG